jgi:hypothetical protein
MERGALQQNESARETRVAGSTLSFYLTMPSPSQSDPHLDRDRLYDGDPFMRTLTKSPHFREELVHYDSKSLEDYASPIGDTLAVAGGDYFL